MKWYYYISFGLIAWLFWRRYLRHQAEINAAAPVEPPVGTPAPTEPAAPVISPKIRQILFSDYLINNVNHDDLPALGKILETENYINNDPSAASWKYDITARAALNGITYQERLRLETIYSIRGF